MPRAVKALGTKRDQPSVYFNPIAQPTSRIPAIKRYIQFIGLPQNERPKPNMDWVGLLHNKL